VVNIDGIPFTMKASELQHPTEKDAKPASPQKSVVKVIAPVVTGDTSHEINLIGQRVDDALIELESFINRSILARIEEVRVVHGFGTGRLRTGIHDWLKKQPAIKSFRLGKEPNEPGGAGCTVVKLKL
jgi:DNA mismatch repair protein MutS2